MLRYLQGHAAVAAGAAFDGEGQRIRSSKGPIAGRCKCSCGWLSDVQPDVFARLRAYRAHQDQSYINEDRHIPPETKRRRSKSIFVKCGSKPREVVAGRFWPFVDRPSDDPDTCWTWNGGRTEKGYGSFDRTGAHRVSYWLMTGEEPGEMDVLHRCDNPPCVRPSHLFLGTHQDNMADMKAKGRNHREIAVTDEQVAEMRRRYLAGENSRTLAQEYGISRAQTARILAGTSRGPAELPEWKRRGFRKPNTKLTDDQVREIREAYAAGDVTTRDLAARYEINCGYVSDLINRKERKDVV